MECLPVPVQCNYYLFCVITPVRLLYIVVCWTEISSGEAFYQKQNHDGNRIGKVLSVGVQRTINLISAKDSPTTLGNYLCLCGCVISNEVEALKEERTWVWSGNPVGSLGIGLVSTETTWKVQTNKWEFRSAFDKWSVRYLKSSSTYVDLGYLSFARIPRAQRLLLRHLCRP